MTHLPKNIDVHVFRQREGVRWRARATCTDPATGNQLSVVTRAVGEDTAEIASAVAVQLLEHKLAQLLGVATGITAVGSPDAICPYCYVLRPANHDGPHDMPSEGSTA